MRTNFSYFYQDMSRYDDLWSIYYISVENMVGQLPWRYVNEKSEVEKMKESIDLLKQKYGTEANPPASLVVLYRHLCHASFYHEPEYRHIVNEIVSPIYFSDFNLQTIPYIFKKSICIITFDRNNFQDLDLAQRNFNADSRLDWQPIQKVITFPVILPVMSVYVQPSFLSLFSMNFPQQNNRSHR